MKIKMKTNIKMKIMKINTKIKMRIKMIIMIMKIKLKNEDYENKYEDKDADKDDYYDYENQNKAINQNEIIKEKNDNLDKIIDKSRPFEDQIKSLKKVENLNDYFDENYFDDKELKYKYFKIELAKMSNEIDEKLFKQKFGHTLIKLVEKLINTTNKEENQIITKNIGRSKDKPFEKQKIRPCDFLIRLQQDVDLKYTTDLILNFNEDQLDLV